MMKNMVGVMKKVQEMQDRMQELQAEMAQANFSASVAGGAVSVTLNGKGIMQSIKIDPDALDPTEIDTLEDMICLATNNARAEADEQMAARMKDITGGLPLPPGMTLPF